MTDEEPRTTLSDRTQVYPEYRNIIKEGARKGQQEGYVVLAQEEIDKGFVRPLRRSYRHLKCGVVTTMGQTIAETYARNPHFYTGLEKQVHDAWVAVEFEGAHPQLTNASSFLQRALEALLDWTDSGRPGAYEDDEND